MDSRRAIYLDRISKLPDELLCKILSRLPTKYVVGTSVLSRRWQNIWASVPLLDLDNLLYFNTSKRGKMSADLRFMNFVDRVIFLTDVSSFTSFCLEYYNITDNFRVSSWIYSVLKRNVTVIELCYLADHPISLPSKIFESKTLVVLKLKNAIRVEVPDSVLLPSLKILHLLTIMKYKDEDSTQKLFSGCPVLEELYIHLSIFDTRIALEVSVPTLKHVRLKNYKYPTSAASFLLRINAPKLEHLDITDRVAEEIYFENLSSMSKACINLSRCTDVILKLFEGIKDVKSSFLCEETLNNFDYIVNLPFPTFQNLIRLELEAVGDYCWCMLAVFLGISPNLEVLILHKRAFHAYYNMCESETSWDEPLALKESTLLLRLKEVYIGEFNGFMFEIEAIGFILRNAIVLKTMTIDCRSPDIKMDMRKILTGLPTASKDFQLNLLLKSCERTAMYKNPSHPLS